MSCPQDKLGYSWIEIQLGQLAVLGDRFSKIKESQLDVNCKGKMRPRALKGSKFSDLLRTDFDNDKILYKS